MNIVFSDYNLFEMCPSARVRSGLVRPVWRYWDPLKHIALALIIEAAQPAREALVWLRAFFG